LPGEAAEARVDDLGDLAAVVRQVHGVQEARDAEQLIDVVGQSRSDLAGNHGGRTGYASFWPLATIVG
jgi:hypothetical protein